MSTNKRTTEDWNRWGYPSGQPCCVCGTTDDTKEEPRFGYVICKEHSVIPPNKLHLYRKE